MPASSTESSLDEAWPGLPCRALEILAQRCEAAASTDDVAAVVGEVGHLVAGYAGNGLAGHLLAGLISALNDRAVRRVIAITVPEHRLPAVSWCWLALGSEGRQEQTFVTDQDNGLIFSAADDTEAAALRELFLPFARTVNERLDRCGFSFCKGEVMAGNPRWCLSFDEWRRCFIDWVRRPDPLALMHATIFFDLCPLYGDLALGQALQRSVLQLTADTPAFLHLMAANALQAQPPLGLLGDVVTEAGEHGQVVDLKKYGARIFVDAARIFALAKGEGAVATRDRLALAGAAAGMTEEEVAAGLDALSHLLRLRLARQAQALARGETPHHGVVPEQLHGVDRAILRESLREARRVQQRLKLNYAL